MTEFSSPMCDCVCAFLHSYPHMPPSHRCAGNPSAASVVALFAMFFRNTTRGSLLDSLRTSFRATAELPIATAAADDAAKQVIRDQNEQFHVVCTDSCTDLPCPCTSGILALNYTLHWRQPSSYTLGHPCMYSCPLDVHNVCTLPCHGAPYPCACPVHVGAA